MFWYRYTWLPLRLIKSTWATSPFRRKICRLVPFSQISQIVLILLRKRRNRGIARRTRRTSGISGMACSLLTRPIQRNQRRSFLFILSRIDQLTTRQVIINRHGFLLLPAPFVCCWLCAETIAISTLLGFGRQNESSPSLTAVKKFRLNSTSFFVYSESDRWDFLAFRSSILAKIHDLRAAAVPAITLTTTTCSISDRSKLTLSVIMSSTITWAREKKIKQQKTMYEMLKISKPTVGLFFLLINSILNSIANKFSSCSPDNITYWNWMWA